MYAFKTLFFAMLLFSASINAHDTTDKTTQTADTPLPIKNPDIKTFIEAGSAVGLKDLFQGTGPFTLFAPSNAAVVKYGTDKFNKLLKPENHDALVDLILYHVVPGEYLSKSIKKDMTVRTINGKELQITVENGEIRVNGAKVIHADMEGPNGVVHEIDTVLVPG